MSIPINVPLSQTPEKSILDNNNRQVYLGQTFLYSINSLAITPTSETPLVLIENPASNSLSLFLNFKRLTCLTSSATAIFRIYINPTITFLGTLKTPVNLRTGATTTSKALVYLSPSTSSNGTFYATLASAYSVPDVSQVLTIIDPGSNYLITVQVSTASTAISSEFIWYEI